MNKRNHKCVFCSIEDLKYELRKQMIRKQSVTLIENPFCVQFFIVQSTKVDIELESLINF